jgi:hypothetical protein
VLGVEESLIDLRPSVPGADLVARVRGTTFVIEAKHRGDLVSVQNAAFQVGRLGLPRGSVPLVAVPFMTERSAACLAEIGLSWFDLAGNADITAPGLRVRIRGQARPPRRRGRPADPFAPKRARISHLLLQRPSITWRQQDLANASGLDRGYVSRTLQVLISAGLVERRGGREFGPRDASSYFEAWRDAYRFSQHQVLKGHVGARSGEELSEQFARRADAASLRYALTALPAAFQLAAFGGFRLVTAYLASAPEESWLSDLRFRPEPRGANLWLVVPKDEGVFLGAQATGGLHCVSAVQVSLDLKDHPERAAEADAALRQKLLTWSLSTREAPARG